MKEITRPKKGSIKVLKTTKGIENKKCEWNIRAFWKKNQKRERGDTK